MLPAVRRAGSFVLDFFRRGGSAIRRHPFLSLALLPALVLAYVLALVPFTPSIGDLRKAKSEAPARVLSADGVILAEYKRINREWVPLRQISPHVVNALISTEDHRFYDHHGVDIRRIGSAAIANFRGDRQGGSTITQQLARNLYPEDIGHAPTLTRKIKEAITAIKIESAYSKDEILETYLNTVPFLYNAFGIEMAARTYFDKNAHDLDVLESATLIGMLKGNSIYNPVTNPERARDRRNVVLAQMARYGKIEPTRLAALQQRPLKVDFERQGDQLGPAPHVARNLRSWLIEWADAHGFDIHTDGLVVRTTIDSRLQVAANAAVERQMTALQKLADARVKKGEAKPQLEAGFLAIDPQSGRMLAWVGSRDFAQDQFDHVSQARRQPGSTFKPFVYGAAFMLGLDPLDFFIDQPVIIRTSGSAPWSPTDGTPPTGERMTLRQGLAHSRNTITAQVMERVGPKQVAQLARAMGVRQSTLDEVPSLALGTSPVTLKEMVAAYATIADEGLYREPILVTSVERRNGQVLEQFKLPEPEQAMPRPQALTLVDVMRGVVDEGTGTAIRSRYGIHADVAGKTGTTQDNTDGWFILAHPQLVAGAWVGFNDSSISMGNGWGPGAQSALPIVGDFFRQSLNKQWIDAKVEFAIPRPRPAPPPEPMQPDAAQPQQNPLDALGSFLHRLFH